MKPRLNHLIISVILPIAVIAITLTFLATKSASSAAFSQLSTTSNSERISSQPGQVITIGVAAPLSGGVDFLGWPVANAVQLAISQTNEAGGLNLGGISYTLALAYADDLCDPTQAITAANTLVDAGVSAVVGHVCSSASMYGQPIFAAANIPMISPTSTRIDLTQLGYTNTFRTISNDSVSPRVLAMYFRDWMALSRVAIVEGFDTPGAVTGDVFSQTFTSMGGIITSRRQISSVDEFTSTLTTIQGENPDGIYFIDEDVTRAGLFSQMAHNLPMSNVIMGWTTRDNFDDSILGTYVTASGAGAAENDYVVLQYRHIQDMPGWMDLYSDYTAAGFEHYGTNPIIYTAFAYDAANIIIEAIQRAGNGSPAAIRDQIAATENFQGVVGTYIGFDEHGDVAPPWCWIERFVGGAWHYVYPTQMFMPAIIR